MISVDRYKENLITYGQMNLIINARNLWRDFVMWSRIYLISRLAGIGTPNEVFYRIYRIPNGFGNVLRLIFGDEIAEKYIHLLSQTIIIFSELIEAQLIGNVELVTEKVRQLYMNADERAKFLATINPYWEEVQWKSLMYTFYQYSFDEIISIQTNDARNIDIFDRLLQHANTMGDYFSQGVFNYLTNTEQNNNK